MKKTPATLKDKNLLASINRQKSQAISAPPLHTKTDKTQKKEAIDPPCPIQQANESASALQTKIFAGIPLNANLTLLLEECKQWQIDKSTQESGSDNLIEITQEDKKYIGRFLNETQPTRQEIEKNASAIRQHLLSYLPELNEESLSIKIFAQIFLQ